MKKKILIVGSTGKLGTKLLNYLNKNSISVYCITCYKNISKLSHQKKLYDIKNSFVLSDTNDQIKFFQFLKYYRLKILEIFGNLFHLDHFQLRIYFHKFFLNFQDE